MFRSQFDSNTTFSGGGFMPSQATLTANRPFTSSKSSETWHLLPLTVKNALLSSDDAKNVKLVGMVVNKAERGKNVSFVIDDGTGRIDCVRWILGAVEMTEMEGIMDGMYVCVHGYLKYFYAEKQLSLFSIRPVTDFNEITYHYVECTYVHYYNTRLQGSAPSTSHIPYSADSTPLNGYHAAPSNQFSGMGYTTDGLSGVDKVVLNYIQRPSCLAPEMGVHRDQIARDLNLTMEKLMECMAALEAEGLIYSTVDEYRYRSTRNG